MTYSNGSTAETTLFAYIDDILLASNSEEDHHIELKALFTRLAGHGLRINLLKCEFGQNSLEFLGHFINVNSEASLPEKVATMCD